MITITPHIALDESWLRFSFIRASGPGGQNVNRVASAVQLRFDAAHCPALAEDVRARLLRQAGYRATAQGEIVIEAKRFRSQARNREDAIQRLVDLIRRAAVAPKPRRKKRLSAAAKAKRLDRKKKHAQVKKLRGRVRAPVD